MHNGLRVKYSPEIKVGSYYYVVASTFDLVGKVTNVTPTHLELAPGWGKVSRGENTHNNNRGDMGRIVTGKAKLSTWVVWDKVHGISVRLKQLSTLVEM